MRHHPLPSVLSNQQLVCRIISTAGQSWTNLNLVPRPYGAAATFLRCVCANQELYKEDL